MVSVISHGFSIGNLTHTLKIVKISTSLLVFYSSMPLAILESFFCLLLYRLAFR